MWKNNVQVTKDHYDFNKYVDNARWNSYFCQISEVAECKGNSVLLIWVWDWIVVDVLKRIGKNVTTFDFDESLDPDIVWDVTKIDEIITKKYDAVVCCQVLEHIPFEVFESTIKKIGNIINERLILSLPNRNIWIKFWFFMPIIRNIVFKFRFRMFWENKWDINKNGCWEHYREVDATTERKLKKIQNILKKYFKIENYFVSIYNTYHSFFILGKK